MSGFSSSGALLWATILLLALSVVGSIVLLRRITDNRLVGLSLAACAAALVFVPLLRVLPESVGLPVLIAGLGPLLVILAVVFVTSVVRFIQARTRTHLLSLALSGAAVALFFVNAMTAWIWPYASY
ncbi:MAG: hypothetical protein V9H69_09505 [Anaerolineae bacterium]|jgi:zinc transporter ZupT